VGCAVTTVTNPAPCPLVTVTLSTDSGDVEVPCEPINEWLGITAAFGMDDAGRTFLDGRFTITHRPTGLNFVASPGCIQCCRSAGRAMVALDLDWPSLTAANGTEWAKALPDDVRVAFADARSVGFYCTAGACPLWPSEAVTS
jgi:hypothetical protein